MEVEYIFRGGTDMKKVTKVLAIFIMSLTLCISGILEPATVYALSIQSNGNYAPTKTSSDINELADYVLDQFNNQANEIIIKYTGSDFNNYFLYGWSNSSFEEIFNDESTSSPTKPVGRLTLNFEKILYDKNENFGSSGTGRIAKTYKTVVDVNAHTFGYINITYNDYSQTDEYIKNAIKEMKITNKTSDIEKVTLIAEYICNNFEHWDKTRTGNEDFDNSEYQMITNGEGVCVNYSWTFKRFCDLAGIECKNISGIVKAVSEGHMWNIVKVAGKWYSIDVTSMDKRQGVDYTNFLLSKQSMLNTYTLDSWDYGDSDKSSFSGYEKYITGSSINDLNWASKDYYTYKNFVIRDMEFDGKGYSQSSISVPSSDGATSAEIKRDVYKNIPQKEIYPYGKVEGYVFTGYFTDQSWTSLFDGTYKSTEDNILYSGFIKQENLKLKSSFLKIKKGKAQGLSFNIKIEPTLITWSSTNKKIATVNASGKITAKKKGNCYVKATIGGKTYKCKITVK